jgi:hypothetical protein
LVNVLTHWYNEVVDTPLEIALLSVTAGVIDIRPVEAAAMLPAGDLALIDLQLGRAAYMDMQTAKFLGGNSAPHAAALQYITGRGRVTEADVKDFVKQGIAAVVREKFNTIEFRLENWTNSYWVALSRNPKTGEYTLSYDYTEDVVRAISGTGINGLLAAMKNSPDFDARGSAFRLVQEKAAFIPAVVYGSWIEKKITKIDAVQLAADTIANFYLSPTSANYDLLVGVFGLFNRRRGINDPVAEAGREAFHAILNELNKSISDKAYDESFVRGAALAQAAQAHNSAYGVFAIPYK